MPLTLLRFFGVEREPFEARRAFFDIGVFAAKLRRPFPHTNTSDFIEISGVERELLAVRVESA
jgi:hypothetical protein